ncbi:MAG: hypothetical protein MI920_18740, partial [Kiloniellales bacterium]|nr:hypothetical protein [Kiloniellales bacterium]
MSHLLSRMIGSGASPDDPIRPAAADSLSHWWLVAGDGTRGLVGRLAGDRSAAADDIVVRRSNLAALRTRLGIADLPDLDGEVLALQIACRLCGHDRARVSARGPSRSGTFTDDFNRADEDLEDSAVWTRLAATNAGTIKVRSNEVEFFAATAETLYVCPDQGDADHYTQYRYTGSVELDTGAAPFRAAVRALNGDSWFGVWHLNGLELYKRDGSWN